MKQFVTIKVFDETGLDEQAQRILDASIVHLASMRSSIVVYSKGEGGEGVALNPVEDCLCGVEMIYQKAIPDELAEEFKSALERNLKTFFAMCELEMRFEIQTK